MSWEEVAVAGEETCAEGGEDFLRGFVQAEGEN